MSTPPVPVYIVEDNPEQRMLVHDIVEATDFRPRDFVSSEEVLAVYERLSPGIILLDLRLPGMGGASLVEELVRRGCWWPIVIVTARPDAGEVERVRKAGAVNILRKPLKGRAVIEALEDARKHLGSARIEHPHPAIQARFARLKPGERTVLDGLRAGLKSKQIAVKCGISERSVRTRIHRILDKTGADSREHLLQLAATAGLPVKPPA